MNYDDSPEELAFRKELRAWLRENAPADPTPEDEDTRVAYHHDWHRRLYAGGWLGLSWPEEYGGRGLAPIYEAILNDEVGAAGAPPVPGIGFLGRAIQHYGTDEQKRNWLPALLSGTERWCQGFSEPGSGSDLGSLRTKAVRSGDHYVVSGQKVWTSHARVDHWILALVRTDPEAPKHKGITALAIPMDTPGVTVRDLGLITGSRDFNEVFFDDVTVPVGNRIGPENGGWNLAMTTLGFERGPADVGFTSRYRRTLDQLEDVARRRDISSSTRETVATAYVAVEVLRLHVLRSLSARVAAGGGAPGPEGSIDKLLTIRTEQALHHAEMDVHGSDPLIGEAPQALFSYLKSRAVSIAGGTSQIQQNIVATRVLRLPAK